ncbi:MAG TPA: hypothetical protein VKD70_00045 [Candidatus Acidoferrum sp.]|nr:hypothetical protein [Candidatus Acidoferrum sp.]
MSAIVMVSVTMATSFQKIDPARPSLLSRRKKFTPALKAMRWITMVHMMAEEPTKSGIRIAVWWACVIL